MRVYADPPSRVFNFSFQQSLRFMLRHAKDVRLHAWDIIRVKNTNKLLPSAFVAFGCKDHNDDNNNKSNDNGSGGGAMLLRLRLGVCGGVSIT